MTWPAQMRWDGVAISNALDDVTSSNGLDDVVSSYTLDDVANNIRQTLPSRKQ